MTDAEQVHYLQCGMATEAGQKWAAAEIERLTAALQAIDTLATRHVKGAIGQAQKIARGALAGDRQTGARR